MNEDIEAALGAAKSMRRERWSGSLNPLSSLPAPKESVRQALKGRIRLLAAAYVSLAGFVDDDDARFAARHPKSKRAKAIFLKMIEDMEAAQKEMRRFKIL